MTNRPTAITATAAISMIVPTLEVAGTGGTGAHAGGLAVFLGVGLAGVNWLGIEGEEDIAKRKSLLRAIGYKQ